MFMDFSKKSDIVLFDILRDTIKLACSERQLNWYKAGHRASEKKCNRKLKSS